jgi:hypothetical protein
MLQQGKQEDPNLTIQNLTELRHFEKKRILRGRSISYIEDDNHSRLSSLHQDVTSSDSQENYYDSEESTYTLTTDRNPRNNSSIATGLPNMQYNTGKWTEEEEEKFRQFMQFMIASEKQSPKPNSKKKRRHFFQLMSKFIGTRDADQCKSHDQKLRSRIKKDKLKIKRQRNSNLRKKVHKEEDNITTYSEHSPIQTEQETENNKQIIQIFYHQANGMTSQDDYIDYSASSDNFTVYSSPKRIESQLFESEDLASLFDIKPMRTILVLDASANRMEEKENISSIFYSSRTSLTLSLQW